MITKYAQIYRHARLALICLGADKDVLEKYQELHKTDLHVNKDIMEENQFNQRNDVLPWFWFLGSDGSKNVEEWTKECKFYTSSTYMHWLYYAF